MTLTTAQLNERLDRAKAAQLKELGIADPGKAKATLAAAYAAEEANKNAETRAAELAASLKTTQTAAEQQLAIIKEHAARMIGVLTAEEQKAVRDIAGDDPGKQLQTIHALQPIWAKAHAQPTTPGMNGIPPAPPANTAPPPNAPTGAQGNSPTDHRAVYQQASQQNPFAAAAYGMKHAVEIYTPKT
jgi:hypothetical protein